MTLTTVQLQTLKTLVQADSGMASSLSVGQDQVVADWLNANADVDHWVWRTSVPPDEYREAVVWTEVDALLAGKARIWEWLTGGMLQDFNPSKLNVRQGLADAWGSGTTTRTNLLALSKRKASRVEKALATGTGTSGTPATMQYEGPITPAEVSMLRSV